MKLLAEDGFADRRGECLDFNGRLANRSRLTRSAAGSPPIARGHSPIATAASSCCRLAESSFAFRSSSCFSAMATMTAKLIATRLLECQLVLDGFGLAVQDGECPAARRPSPPPATRAERSTGRHRFCGSSAVIRRRHSLPHPHDHHQNDEDAHDVRHDIEERVAADRRSIRPGRMRRMK